MSLLPHAVLRNLQPDAATVVVGQEASFRRLGRKLLCSDVRPCHFSALVTAMPELINPVPRHTPALVEILSRSGPGAFLLLNEMRNAAMGTVVVVCSKPHSYYYLLHTSCILLHVLRSPSQAYYYYSASH